MAKRDTGFRAALKVEFSQKFAYDECDRIEYIGETYPENQAKLGEAVWRIKKLTYVFGSGCPDEIESMSWANGSATFSFSWNAREGYEY